ncbi:MAG: hypothetical protein WBO09_18555 [Methylocystis silviterrae]|uniref:hypothetical protein n=1 Tax=Methylocystis silviterrae TaxID=2743612 RepID=UPI003C788AE6
MWRTPRVRHAAVKRRTNTPKVVVLSVETSEANNSVTIGIGPNRAAQRGIRLGARKPGGTGGAGYEIVLYKTLR